MAEKRGLAANLDFRPVTSDRWADLEALFGAHGAFAGCWCMWWRLTRAEFAKQAGAGNKEAMKRIVESGQAPGILAYANGQPVGWCSVASREAFPSLDRSRTLKRVDEQSVWSIVCFFVSKPFRRRGLMQRMISAAVEYAASRGATIIEAYPTEPEDGAKLAWAAGYMGLAPAFRRAGFQEVARRSPRHPVMRYYVH